MLSISTCGHTPGGSYDAYRINRSGSGSFDNGDSVDGSGGGDQPDVR